MLNLVEERELINATLARKIFSLFSWLRDKYFLSSTVLSFKTVGINCLFMGFFFFTGHAMKLVTCICI